MTTAIPAGLCLCGCGAATRVAAVNDKSKGCVKGQPVAYVKGHHLRRDKSGDLSPRWSGGRHLSSHGYVVLWTPNGRRYEHVVIAERALGRQLRHFRRGHPKNEVVHHINGVKTDNRPENLLICTHEYHIALHHRLEASPAWPEFKPIQREGFGRTSQCP